MLVCVSVCVYEMTGREGGEERGGVKQGTRAKAFFSAFLASAFKLRGIEGGRMTRTRMAQNKRRDGRRRRRNKSENCTCIAYGVL